MATERPLSNSPFSRAATLDGTSKDDLELRAVARLGREVRLIAIAEGSGKDFKLNRKGPHDDDELSFSLTLKVVSVEAAEMA
jgi:hypothetical protein